jgi:hypothetical protein
VTGSVSRALATALALSVACGVQGRAQKNHRLRLAFGMGYGRGNSSCDHCKAGPSVGGLTAVGSVERAVSPSFQTGVTFDSWWHSSGAATERMIHVLGSFHAALSRSDSFVSLLCFARCFITAGAGLASYHANVPPSVSGTGWGLMAGYGYDLPLAHGIQFEPAVRYVFGRVGDLGLAGGGGTFATGWKQHWMEFGAGLRFR